MFQANVADKIKTHILCSTTFFPKIVQFIRYVQQYDRAGEATGDNNTAHALCMSDN